MVPAKDAGRWSSQVKELQLWKTSASRPRSLGFHLAGNKEQLLFAFKYDVLFC